MPITEKDVKRFSLIVLLIALAGLVFFTVKPVLISILGGLILAYIFFPVYKFSVRFLKNPTLSAAVVSVIIVLLIFVPLYFILPILAEQLFEFFKATQSVDVTTIVKQILPRASEQLTAQISLTLNNAVGKTTSVVLNIFTEFFVNFAIFALNLLLMAVVFFFALKDEEKLREFVSGLSPLNKSQDKNLSNQFKDITKAIIQGQVVTGFIQGVLAGIGFFYFGVPNPLFSTFLAIFASIIPLVGPGLVYIPIAIYMILSGNTTTVIFFLAYNLLFVSVIDNFIRARFVSKRTNLSAVIVLIGMIGGLLFMGIIGLILGPLLLAYFVTFLKAYKDRSLSSFFAEDI